jgi:uncharacterized membrane protein YfcA
MPIEWLLYPALGVVAGLLAGLLGVGGGLVLVAALALLLPTQGVPASIAMQAALATSLASVIATACASALAHHRRGGVLWPSVAWLAPGLVAGGWLGSLVARRIDGAHLRWFVVAYCVLAAVQLAFDLPRPRRAPPVDGPVPAPTGLPLGLAGLGIGAVSALVGIGGGSMTVPLLVWRGVAPVRAVGTSSACGIVIGLSAAGGFASAGHVAGMPAASLGYVVLPAAIGIALASIAMAPAGAALAHRIRPVLLKRIFAAFLLAMAAVLAA